MKTLQLSLKKKWFEMTKAEIKTEDYREITPYWAKRLVGNWGYVGESNGLFPNLHNSFMSSLNILDFKSLKVNKMTLGYPKSTDTERIIELEHKGIEIGYGNPEWGAEEGKLYFVIKHGEIINKKEV
ncbi:hypothetical protein [Joostella sp.]|uniref:hypothetical protein n=1 Tax=Joostella sp. TaxID=2231138 RepID=UPI003A948652